MESSLSLLVRILVRLRPIAALSVAALSALVLAGCASSPEGSETPDPNASAGDLCASAAPAGALSDSVTVEGEFGEPATVTFETPMDVTAAERTVAVPGDGDQLADGDLVEYALTVFNAETGAEEASEGYETPVLPVALTVGAGADQFFGCAPVGSRIVMTLPASDASSAAVWVLDVLGTTPTAAWGDEVDPPSGMPTVKLDENGAPEITIPEGDAPTEVEIATLKSGDGAVVQSGDNVLVQYTGVRWSDGEVFDSSWDRGAPASFSTTGVVAGFQQALEGQTVGSQVLVVIPPAFGYGTEGNEDNELFDQTLVFVVDILAAQAAPQPAG